jgi:D-serine deaminase-like pyridoxal phosphate-dependent protein
LVLIAERGTKIEDLDTPVLLLDLDILESNIKKMAEFFRNKPVRLRPHIKTHKTPIIAHKQVAAGADGIACQKLTEAEVMVESGIRDVFVTNQVVGWNKALRLARLAHHSKISVIVDDAMNVRQLSQAASQVGVTLNVLVEVNVGMNRCGVPPGKPAVTLAKEIVNAHGLKFQGILGYEGHCVLLDDYAKKKQLCLEALAKDVETKQLLIDSGLDVEKVCAGGTSTYDITGLYPGITEIHPGTYATMDLKFKNMGMPFDCAVTLLTSVISTPTTGRATIDAGMKAISQEFGIPKVDRSDTKLVHLYEEHGLLELGESAKPLHPADKVQLVPTHGCTTINLHDKFHCTRRGYLEAVWNIAGRGKFS